MSRFKLTLVRHLLAAQVLLGGLLVLAGQGLAGATEVHIVSARNGAVPALTRDEAEQLFLGRRTTLTDGTPVTLIDLPVGPVRDHLYLRLTGKNPIQTRAYWSRQVFTGRAQPPREAENIEQARNWIATTPSAIGYLPATQVDNRLLTLIRLP